MDFRNILSGLHNHLQPGDKMVMQFHKNAKPSWLTNQQGQPMAGGGMFGRAAQGAQTDMASASPFSSGGMGAIGGAIKRMGLNGGSGTTPAPGPMPNAAMPPAPMSSPDDTANTQMLIQRMQQMQGGPGGGADSV